MFFVEKLCVLSAITGTEIEVEPRLRRQCDRRRFDPLDSRIPHSFVQTDRVHFSLTDLWITEASFIPADLAVPWSLPTKIACWKSLSTLVCYHCTPKCGSQMARTLETNHHAQVACECRHQFLVCVVWLAVKFGTS